MLLRSALFATWMIVGSAHAQDAPPAGYRPIIDEAVREFAAGHWEEARALFRRAHEVYPNARTLRGIGMASFELRDYLAALRALREALTEARQPLTAEQRTQVEELLGRTRAFIASYDFEVPEGATLTVDGVPATLEDGRLLLAAGTREVRVREDGREALARLEIAGGESGPLPIDLAPLEAPAERPSRRTEVRDSPNRPVQWTFVVGGLVVAAGGGVMLGVGVADIRSIEGAAYGTPWLNLREAYDRAPALTAAGTALLGVGAAALAVGLIWFLVDGPTVVEVQARLDGISIVGRL